ncbi:MAG: matrixin family metalloprotease [Acidobacteriota bacterium]
MKRNVLTLLNVFVSIALLVAPAAMACFAPKTDPGLIQRMQDSGQREHTSVGLASRYRVTSSWTETATDGSGLSKGDPITLTWSIVPDGSIVYDEGVAYISNLQSFLNGIYGNQATWLAVLQQVFDDWSEVSGVNYVYEPNDDGAWAGEQPGDVYSPHSGDLGVRGDVRLFGHTIDGNSNTLAYNYYPAYGGDMAIDTSDNFYDDTSNNSIKFRNTVAHELGHGLGLRHVCPISETKLMEPYLTTAFDGPQHDDILALNRNHGDYLESNETPGTATVFGAFHSGDAISYDELSIDDDSDADYFSFSYDGVSPLQLSVSPVGSTYLSGNQNSDGSCSAGSSFNSAATQDLQVAILDSSGSTVVQSIDNTGAGSAETLSDYSLPAGDYYLEVAAFSNAAQLYDLEMKSGSVDEFAFGRETIDEITRTVSLSGVSNARVVMGPATYNGTDPGTIRLANVSDSSFQHRFQEWDYENGTHDDETASWLALPAGVSFLGDLEAEAGDVSVDEVWVTVSFGRTFSSTPVVIPTVTTKNGSSAVVARLRNVSTTGFEIRLQEEEANDDNHAFETVHWVAVQPGITVANGHVILVTRTGNSVTDEWFAFALPPQFSNAAFIAASQTYDGSDPATVRYQNISFLGFEYFQVKIHEEVSADTETGHNSEDVGFIVID